MGDIRDAAMRIQAFVHRTPVLECRTIDRMVGARIFFKCENFQKAGAFKIRGAANAVFSLTEEEANRGVATHSSGNHAAALALAARWRGIAAHVVMPEGSSPAKQKAVAEYGASVVLCEATLEARERGLRDLVERTGAVVIHPYNDAKVIAGQGTAAMELCEEIPDLEAVLVPVGGGGLLAGTSIAVSALCPGTSVMGAEPEVADDARRSLEAGRIIPSTYPATIADGLRSSLGDLTFSIIRKHVEGILTAGEVSIAHAMRIIWERMKIVVEPSAAVPLAAVMSNPALFSGRRVGIILSGGNVDLERLPWLPRTR